MRLRTLAVLLTLALCLLAAPLPAGAQQAGKVYRIGWLGTSNEHISPFLGPFQRELRALGWKREDFVLEHRWAYGNYERFPALAAELVRLKVDVIVAVSAPGTQAAMNATKTIPIVFAMVGDPVGAGFVTSLPRPGGNVTGVANIALEPGAKQLEVLKEVVPGLTRVAVLWNPTAPDKTGEWKKLQAAARAMGMELQSVEVRSPDGLESAFEVVLRGRAGALIVLWDPLTFAYARRILDLATKTRLPAIYPDRWFMHLQAGLMSYGPDAAELSHRLATYVDKIRKGTRPADLPVEQPTRFELVINLKTARALGLTIPPSVRAQADEVIE